MSFQWWPKQGMRRPPLNDVSAVAESWPLPNVSFGGGLKPPPKRHLVVATVLLVYFAYCLT